MSTSVNQIGGNTLTVNDGNTTWIIEDRNNDGKVDAGDVVTGATSGNGGSDAVYNYTIGGDEGAELWGDPHLYNDKFTKDGKAAIETAFNNLYQAAKGGQLADPSLLAAATTAYTSNATREYITDLQSNFTLRNNDSNLQLKVAKTGAVAYVDGIDMTVSGADGKDHTITVASVWTGAHAAGTMTVAADAPAQPDTEDPGPLFVKLDGANVQNGTMVYGEEAGMNGQSNTALKVDGELMPRNAVQSMESIKFYDNSIRNTIGAALDLAEQNTKDAEAEKQATTPAATSTPKAPADGTTGVAPADASIDAVQILANQNKKDQQVANQTTKPAGTSTAPGVTSAPSATSTPVGSSSAALLIA